MVTETHGGPALFEPDLSRMSKHLSNDADAG